MNAPKEPIPPGLGRQGKWRNGLLALPWALLKELHEEELRWGAVFDAVDLHHFEVV